MATKSLKELRFLFCVEGSGSEGLRQFVKKNLVDIQLQNRSLNVLTRYGQGNQAKILASYPRLQEKAIVVENMNEAEIKKTVDSLLN